MLGHFSCRDWLIGLILQFSLSPLLPFWTFFTLPVILVPSPPSASPYSNQWDGGNKANCNGSGVEREQEFFLGKGLLQKYASAGNLTGQGRKGADFNPCVQKGSFKQSYLFLPCCVLSSLEEDCPVVRQFSHCSNLALSNREKASSSVICEPSGKNEREFQNSLNLNKNHILAMRGEMETLVLDHRIDMFIKPLDRLQISMWIQCQKLEQATRCGADCGWACLLPSRDGEKLLLGAAIHQFHSGHPQQQRHQHPFSLWDVLVKRFSPVGELADGKPRCSGSTRNFRMGSGATTYQFSAII